MIENIKIIDTAYEGVGVGKLDSGQVIFIPKTVEGDICNAEIISEKKNFINGKLKNIITPSKSRIIPECEYASICGGCSFAHINYEDQINIKIKIIKNALRKYQGKLPDIKIHKSEVNEYRHRATLRTISGKIGFYEQGTNKLVEVKNCRIIKKSLFNKIMEFASVTNLTGEIYAIENEESIALCSVITKEKFLTKNDVFDGVEINGKKFGISKMHFNTPYGAIPVTNKSFFQANRHLLLEFQKTAIEYVPNQLSIVELYAGAGFFTCGLMNKSKVFACEGDNIASSLGKEIGYNIKNKDSYEFLKNIKKYDVLFVDPPRDGLDKKIIPLILKEKPFKIVYVSCNPITLARDILKINEFYNIDSYDLFDMYPDTYHVESIVVLTLKQK